MSQLDMIDNPHPAIASEKHQGICAHCGFPFSGVRDDKQFGSHECYMASDVCRENMERERERLRSTGHRVMCSNGCGAEIRKPPSRCRETNFCGKPCRREYFAARFDRFVASKVSLREIQNYDEFLAQPELPCLVDGCKWTGRNLSTHANRVHGITAEQLKEKAGFNRQTGLISTGYARYLQQFAAGHLKPPADARAHGGNKGTQWRREGREHHWKKRGVV